MIFHVTPALEAYLKNRKRHIISIEVASSDHSDFDVTEIFLRLVTDDFASYLIDKKNYRQRLSEEGVPILLPSYHLEYDDIVTFDVRKWLFFNKVTYSGIKL